MEGDEEADLVDAHVADHALGVALEALAEVGGGGGVGVVGGVLDVGGGAVGRVGEEQRHVLG